MTPEPLGRWGEQLAASYLEARGWSILDRNYRFGRKEIDLVVRRGGVVAFLEVKARAGAGYGHPLEAITWRKRREIAQVATAWIDRHGEPEAVYRFDAVSVIGSPGSDPRIEHIEDAWRL